MTPEAANIIQVFWSPNGEFIYYVQNVGEGSYLMGQRLDRSHHPAGGAFRVFEFPFGIRSAAITAGNPVPEPLTAIPGRFIGALTERNYNIWLMDLPN